MPGRAARPRGTAAPGRRGGISESQRNGTAGCVQSTLAARHLGARASPSAALPRRPATGHGGQRGTEQSVLKTRSKTGRVSPEKQPGGQAPRGMGAPSTGHCNDAATVHPAAADRQAGTDLASPGSPRPRHGRGPRREHGGRLGT